MKALKIALVSPLWNRVPPQSYGGIELIVAELANGLVERGHDVTLFASGGSATRARLHPVCETSVCELMAQNKADYYTHFALSAMVEALTHPSEFDIIHSHLGLDYLPISKISHRPVIHTMHGAINQDEIWLAKRYPHSIISGISQRQVSELTSAGRNVFVVHNAVNFKSFIPRANHGNGKYLVFLGRIAPQKNPVAAIEVAKRANLPIVLAGPVEHPYEKRYFEEEIRPHLDHNRVRHVGLLEHDAKNELLRDAAAFVFPISWNEPFGLVMIEAMACGTPVLAFNQGAASEIVETGVTGFLASDTEQLAQLVPKALDLDRARVRNMAAAKFDVPRMLDGYEALYAKILS